MMRRFLHCLAAALMLGMIATAAAASESVEVRAGRHDGYQRIVLAWTKPVGHVIAREGAVLVVTFDRPFTADLSPITSRLKGLVTAADLAADGRALRLTLAGEVGVKSSAFGGKVVIDLLEEPGVAAAGSAEPAAPRVAVRANQENGRLRIVVDWPEPVDFDVAVSGGVARVTFARPATLDLGRVAKRAMTLAAGFEAGIDGGSSWLKFDLADGAGVTESHFGGKVVLDITSGSAPAEPEAAVAVAADAPPLPATRPEDDDAEPAPDPELARDDGPRDDRAPTTVVVRDDIVPGAQKPLVPDPWYYAPMLARLKVEDGESLFRFIVNRPIGLAAMVRDGRLWLAFEGRYDVAVVTGSSESDAPCRDLHQVEREAGTLLTCAVPEGLGAVATRDGVVWEVRLSTKVQAPAHALELDTSDPAVVRIAGADATAPIEVPGEGERRLVFIPFREPGTAWPADQWLSRYVLMATNQGVVLEIDGPGIDVASGPEGAEIATDVAEASVRADDLIDPANWPVALDVNEAEKDLALDGDPQSRVAKRITLAQWYLSQGLIADAEGQLGLLASDDPSAMARPDLRALLGAVLTRFGRLDDAQALLGDPVLTGTQVELWRAVLAAEQGDYLAAAERFNIISDSWERMGPPLRAWIGVRLANGLALAGNVADIEGVLAKALGDAPTASGLAWAALVRGNVLAGAGALEEAEGQWRIAATSADRLASAEARAARVDALRGAGQMTVEDAIRELEVLSFAWRGDGRERARNATLADLYRQVRRDRDALRVMRAMVTTYPDAPETPETAEAMAALFREMMMGTAAAVLDPMESLAVFYEFQELAPAEGDGSDLVELLVDRLAAVDLRDKAGDLLALRIAGDVSGDSRARLGTRLAELRLASGRFQDALDALAVSGAQGADRALLERRRLTQAASLAGLGQHDEALALLDGDVGEGATRLRADIHWAAGDWALAAVELEHLVAASGASPELSDDALRLALAYAKAGNTAGSLRTRDRLLAAADESDPRRGILDLLTQVDGSEAMDWHTLPAAVADVGAFEAFLSDYREGLQTVAADATAAVN